MFLAGGTFQFTFTQTHRTGEGKIDSMQECKLSHIDEGRVELVVLRSNLIGVTTETWRGDTRDMLQALHAAQPHAVVPADFRTLLLDNVEMIIREDGHVFENLPTKPYAVHIPNFFCDQIRSMLQACV